MMTKSSLWVAIALMMAMTTVGCSKDDDTITNVPQPDVVTPADPEKPAERSAEQTEETSASAEKMTEKEPDGEASDTGKEADA